MPATATVEQRVIECVYNVVGDTEGRITADTELAYDLGFDSLDYIDLAHQIEREFGVPTAKIEPPDWDNTKVADVVRFVEANLPS